MLLKKNLITKKVFQSAVFKAQQSGGSILDELLEKNFIKEETLLNLFNCEWGFDICDFEKNPIDCNGVSFFKKEMARALRVFPIKMINAETLAILMADPMDENTIKQIQEVTQKRLKIYLGSETEILKLIEGHYETNQLREIEVKDSKEKVEKENSVIVIVDKILEDGVRFGASDIHFESYLKKIEVRFRIDGVLEHYKSFEKEEWRGMISRLKILGECDIGERRMPQDGSFVMEFEERMIDIRLSLVPTIHGEKIVLRLLDQQGFLMKIEDLGFSENQRKRLLEMMKAPNGIIMVSGPTGSGKTTTLYSLLKEYNPIEKNMITIEDPVEFQLEGINQVQVNEKIGLTFSLGLRSILRQDPDIIMVGEIRDEETANVAIRAGVTGHLVLSTIHTNNAVASITRLMDMKVHSYLVAAAIRGVISQRLVKRLCPYCKEERKATTEEAKLLNMTSDTKFFYPKGCPSCHGTGYKGRLAIQEVLGITKGIRRAIGEGESAEHIRMIALKEGLVPFEASIKEWIIKGETSLAEGIEILVFENLWEC